MGVKFANPPLELGLKYHDPPHLTDGIPCQQVKKGNKRKAKKARAKRMEANCKRVIETIAPQQESMMLQSLLVHYLFIMKE